MASSHCLFLGRRPGGHGICRSSSMRSLIMAYVSHDQRVTHYQHATNFQPRHSWSMKEAAYSAAERERKRPMEKSARAKRDRAKEQKSKRVVRIVFSEEAWQSWQSWQSWQLFSWDYVVQDKFPRFWFLIFVWLINEAFTFVPCALICNLLLQHRYPLPHSLTHFTHFTHLTHSTPIIRHSSVFNLLNLSGAPHANYGYLRNHSNSPWSLHPITASSLLLPTCIHLNQSSNNRHHIAPIVQEWRRARCLSQPACLEYPWTLPPPLAPPRPRSMSNNICSQAISMRQNATECAPGRGFDQKAAQFWRNR